MYFWHEESVACGQVGWSSGKPKKWRPDSVL